MAVHLRSVILNTLLAILLIAVWTAAVAWAALSGYLHRPLAPRGNMSLFHQEASAYAREAPVGNVVFTLLRDGEVFASFERSIGDPVSSSTVFQVASVSKWVTAWGVMALVEQGVIDLDAPVSRYLVRWSLPESEFDNREVTVRRLLSHTAGLTDGLGYLGFGPDEAPQTLAESLTDPADVVAGRTGQIRVGIAPGTRWKYSGGGYSVLQLLIEDVTGLPFAEYMSRTILQPLGMDDSTFVDDGALDRLATSYGSDLKPAAHRRYAALAAASLYSTVDDGVRFLQAHLEGDDGQPVGWGVLEPETVAAMSAPHARIMGRDIWGLGVMLYADNDQGGYVLGHDGQNYPAINVTWRLNPATGNGILIMSSGDGSLASVLGGEWVFWETGNVGPWTLAHDAQQLLATVLAGWIVIIALVVFFHFFRRSK